MIYREAGQFKTSYKSDQALLPIAQDRFFVMALVAFAYIVIPMVANDYWLNSIFLQFFIFSLAALGLNILTGYAGQLSLGTGGFMACGAFSAFKLATSFPLLWRHSSFCCGFLIEYRGLPTIPVPVLFLRLLSNCLETITSLVQKQPISPSISLL